MSCRSYREEWIQAPIDTSFLSRQWRKRVRGESKFELYHRRSLEIAVCFALANALKSGEVYVPGSCSYGDYTEYLYPIESEPQAVADYLRDRDLPPDGEQFAAMLRGWLSRAIRGLEQMTSASSLKVLSRPLPVGPVLRAYHQHSMPSSNQNVSEPRSMSARLYSGQFTTLRLRNCSP